MDSCFRGTDGERFARTHDYVVIDLSLSFPRRQESIEMIHTGALFLNQPNLSCLGPFFQARLIRGSLKDLQFSMPYLILLMAIDIIKRS